MPESTATATTAIQTRPCHKITRTGTQSKAGSDPTTENCYPHREISFCRCHWSIWGENWFSQVEKLDEPNLYSQHFEDQKSVPREVKSLTDSIISNAETNGYVPIKKSFVEEVKSIQAWPFGIITNFPAFPGTPEVLEMDVREVVLSICRLAQLTP